jgi:AcrR family transcriptional regulator
VKGAKGNPSRKPGAKPKAKRAARGSVTAATIELLKQAGTAGIAVNEIAAKLSASYGQVYTWFQSTGKRIGEIKKVGL